MGFLIMTSIYKRKYGNFYTYRVLFKGTLYFIIFLFSSFKVEAQTYSTQVKTGASQVEEYISFIKDKRIAIVGNQTSVIGETHLVDSLLKLGIDIKNVFAPEHGFRGTAGAGELVKDGIDVKTGVPIISLHGRKKRKPSVEVLKDIDLVIFDIQDVGVRFYTYISTMHYVMEACAEQNITLVILDRPNPNGHYVDGPVLKEGNESFIGMHPVPIIHGMTIAEYALMINGEKWLNNGVQCKLKIINCKGYKHSDFYKLPIKPSPNLPNMSSIYLYPSLCLFEGTNISVGRGTEFPFQIYGSPDHPKTDFLFTPISVPGAKYPKHKGKVCYGYNLFEFGNNLFRTLGKLHFDWIIKTYKNSNDKANFFRKDGFFRLLTGDVEIRKMIEKGYSAHEIWSSFQNEVKQFKEIRKEYLIYPDFE